MQWRIQQSDETELDKGAVLDCGKRRPLWTEGQWEVQNLQGHQENV